MYAKVVPNLMDALKAADLYEEKKGVCECTYCLSASLS